MIRRTMISAEEVQAIFIQESQKNPYFQRVEVRDKPYESKGVVRGCKAFQIFYDLAPDMRIVDTGSTVVRLDYEITDDTLEDNAPVENFAEHLIRIFWNQAKSDIADAVVNSDGPVNLEVTGTLHPEIQVEVDILNAKRAV
jgi:hypothetical protein